MHVHCAVAQVFNLSVGLRYFQYYDDNVMQVDVLSCCVIKNRKLDITHTYKIKYKILLLFTKNKTNTYQVHIFSGYRRTLGCKFVLAETISSHLCGTNKYFRSVWFALPWKINTVCNHSLWKYWDPKFICFLDFKSFKEVFLFFLFLHCRTSPQLIMK